MNGHRNEKHWLTDEELEYRTFGASLEDAVVEICNMMPLLENAFSGVEYMAAAIRSKELGFDRSRIFWPTSFPNLETFGMAWNDDEELVAEIDPPPDREEGWKLDPHYTSSAPGCRICRPAITPSWLIAEAATRAWAAA